MTQPRPTAIEQLEAARDALRDEVLPTLEGRPRFHTRVTINVLDTVIRELRDGPGADGAEHERLAALLGHDGTLDDLVDELTTGLRDGTVDIDDPTLVDHLRRTARADALIANPRHVDGD